MDHPEFTRASAGLYVTNLLKAAEDYRLARRVGRQGPENAYYLDRTGRWLQPHRSKELNADRVGAAAFAVKEASSWRRAVRPGPVQIIKLYID